MILKIHKGETKAEVTMENDREIHKRVIDGIFSLFGIKLQEKEKPKTISFEPVIRAGVGEPDLNMVSDAVEKAVSDSIETTPNKAEASIDEPKTRPRQLPLLGIKEEGFPLLEKAKCKTKIQCPSCGKENTIKVPWGFRYTFCPECNEKLFIRPGGSAWGEADWEGNIYVANEVYANTDHNN
ncbi:hypothetical protein NST81_02820 [Bacillus sp. FSL W8-0223]|uniref:hypothetical protein n=1 Tax=Bacillus sp. FSL W8-0223 TaxID=2954595 RepID=UPI0030F8B3DB